MRAKFNAFLKDGGHLEAAELAQQFFSQAEVKAVKMVGGLARLRTFCQFWSLKEAALKSIGEGLPFGLDAFEFELSPNLRIVHAPQIMAGRNDSMRRLSRKLIPALHLLFEAWPDVGTRWPFAE
jgi:phosphopantetheinyl transferase (holo-ACP synthase)